MESNWRFGVWKYGLGNAYAHFAARMLNFPNVVLIGYGPPQASNYGTAYGVLDTEGYVYQIIQPVFRPGPGFPYGIAVEPD